MTTLPEPSGLPLPQPTGQHSVRLADGVRLHVESYGPRRAPITVVFLHGWTLDRRIWHRQITALTRQAGGPRVVAYDARGHGRSSATHRLAATLPQLGDDLAAVLAHVEGPVVLVGHSLGGMTIMEYAAAHAAAFAARVRGVVMVSTTAEGHTHTGYGLPHPLSRIVRVLELSGSYVMARCGDVRPHRPLMAAIRPAIRWLMFGERCDNDDLQLTCAAVAGSSLRSIGGFRESAGTQQRLETLRGLPHLPSAVLVGEQDRITPLPCAQGIADALGGDAGLHVCADAGHMLMLERPTEVTAAVAGVLAAAGSRRLRRAA
ncbi:alpha/beta hydrolase [Pilimelia terevasa]|uniref:Alpha/beta hydrolase n=1 Tax=Pilimelia terevasa TaxID=53372 RepID=A0A8J3FHD0_9ACTN|nr:alpha/beta hydrolase [Pilimelia terevasa]GGK28523.1 alpha/beta hydrolase [Pilimelia terevasa]